MFKGSLYFASAETSSMFVRMNIMAYIEICKQLYLVDGFMLRIYYFNIYACVVSLLVFYIYTFIFFFFHSPSTFILFQRIEPDTKTLLTSFISIEINKKMFTFLIRVFNRKKFLWTFTP